MRKRVGLGTYLRLGSCRQLTDESGIAASGDEKREPLYAARGVTFPRLRGGEAIREGAERGGWVAASATGRWRSLGRRRAHGCQRRLYERVCGPRASGERRAGCRRHGCSAGRWSHACRGARLTRAARLQALAALTAPSRLRRSASRQAAAAHRAAVPPPRRERPVRGATRRRPRPSTVRPGFSRQCRASCAATMALPSIVALRVMASTIARTMQSE